MNYPASLATILLVVAGCGGSSGDGGNPPAPPAPPDLPTSCAGNNLINIIAATDNGLSGAGIGPEMAIDDNLDPASRWESPGDPATITFDLGVRYLVREVGIAWFEGDQRVASFSVHASEDGVMQNHHSPARFDEGPKALALLSGHGRLPHLTLMHFAIAHECVHAPASAFEACRKRKASAERQPLAKRAGRNRRGTTRRG